MMNALILLVALAVRSFGSQSPPPNATTAVDYYDPRFGNGSMLDNAGPGVGEPLNVIISGLSSPDVLTDDGFLNFVRGIGYDRECLGLHRGDPQSANLGDGNGWVNQTVELREDYGVPWAGGSCLESLIGGNHFRVYRQNGSLANSSALFLATSKEMNLSTGHNIFPDGYDINRDSFASAAIGNTSFLGVTYSTTVKDVTGLMSAGAQGINHNISVDGVVAVLTVNIISRNGGHDTVASWFQVFAIPTMCIILGLISQYV